MSFSADVSDDFFPELERISDALSEPDARCDPFDLLGVWMSESGIHHDAVNPAGHATGIFQAMPATLRGFGFDGTDEQVSNQFASMTATEQLPWAMRYYMPARGRLMTRASCYLWTFVPADIGLAGDPNAVISAKRGSPACIGGRRSNIFDVNAAFDDNHDLAIQVHELDDHIERAERGPRWAELEARMRDYLGLEPEAPRVTSAPLTTTLGIQYALLSLGIDPGEADGVMGPATRKAILAFQASHGLVRDGVPGPNTRAALALALRAA